MAGIKNVGAALGKFIWGETNENDENDVINEEEIEEPVAAEAPSQSNNSGVNISTGSSVEMRIVKPKRFVEDAFAIADQVIARRTILINFEDTDKAEAERMIEFFVGVAYAIKGKCQKVGKGSTYILSPSNVNVLGEKSEETNNQ